MQKKVGTITSPNNICTVQLPKVLLVYPEIPAGTYWSHTNTLKIIGKKSILPPLGLLTIAAMLPEQCQLRLVDMNVEKLKDCDLHWADVMFLSAMLVQKESFLKTARRAAQLDTLVVAGGPFPSSAYQECHAVNHFLLGEAELIIDDFWQDFCQGRAKKAYARPVKQEEVSALKEYFGEDCQVSLTNTLPDLGMTPVPRFDLLKQNAYRSMAIQTSRGCPVGCEFCDIWRRFGRLPRTRPTALLRKELDYLFQLGWKGSVFIVDDNFIGNKRKVKELLSCLVDWQREHNYVFEFYTEATLTLADDEQLLQGMQEAGFDMVFIGIETPSEAGLRETGKSTNLCGKMSDKVKKIQQYGIQVTAGFIIGFDSDPDDIARLMIDCIQDLGIPVAMVGLLQALPDTDLFDRLKREERLLSLSTGNNTHEFHTNFITKRPAKQVAQDYKNVLQAIYPANLESYFKRCSALIDNFPKPIARAGLGWFELNALLNYFWTLPFQSWRLSALKFILRTLRSKPWLFQTAISLGIQGYHFAQITKKAFEVETVENYLAELIADYHNALKQTFVKGESFSQDVRVRIQKIKADILARATKRMRLVSRDTRLKLDNRYHEFSCELERILEINKIENYLASRLLDFKKLLNEQLAAVENPGCEVIAMIQQTKKEMLNESSLYICKASKDIRELIEKHYLSFTDEIENLCVQLSQPSVALKA